MESINFHAQLSHTVHGQIIVPKCLTNKTFPRIHIVLWAKPSPKRAWWFLQLILWINNSSICMLLIAVWKHGQLSSYSKRNSVKTFLPQVWSHFCTSMLLIGQKTYKYFKSKHNMVSWCGYANENILCPILLATFFFLSIQMQHIFVMRWTKQVFPISCKSSQDSHGEHISIHQEGEEAV